MLVLKASPVNEHEQTKQDFTRFLETESVPLRRAFKNFVQNMLDDATDAQINAWIQNKDLKGFLNYAADYIDEMSDVLPKSFVRSATRELESLSRPGVFGTGKLAISFDPGNSEVADLVESNRLRFIRDVTARQKDAIRSAISDALSSGEGPAAAARRFRSAIGLTQNQYKAVQSYRDALERNSRDALNRALSDARFDRTVARAIDNDTFLSNKQIDRMVARYTENMRDYRATTIARTETTRALNEGKRAAWAQIADELGIKPAKVERRWVATEDDRTRDSHADMDGQTVMGLDEPFESGRGEELMYPGDPDASAEETINCRCTVVVRFPPAPRQVEKAGPPDEPRDDHGRWTRSISIPMSEHKRDDLETQFLERRNNNEEVKLKKVPYRKLRATQPNVDVHHTWGKYGDYGNEHPAGIRTKDGNVHLIDGHHRADAAARNKKSIYVQFYDQ